jgi:hypothetical protein
MEAISIYALSGAVGTVASSPATSALTSWLSSRFLKWRLKKRVKACLCLKGKSTICTKLSSMSHLFLDIDTLYEKYSIPQDATAVNTLPTPLENYMIYPLLREHILRVATLFKGQIILVSSSLELLKAMPVYKEHIFFFPFSKEMEDNIGVIFPNEKEHQQAQLNKFRYLRELPPCQVSVVESLVDMHTKIKEKYGITAIAI